MTEMLRREKEAGSPLPTGDNEKLRTAALFVIATLLRNAGVNQNQAGITAQELLKDALELMAEDE